jgi:hypothetical protein
VDPGGAAEADAPAETDAPPDDTPPDDTPEG